MRELRVVLIFVGIIAQLVFVGPPLRQNIGPNAIPTDFLSFYSGPLLLEQGHLYDMTATGKLQFELMRRNPEDPALFVRLPFYAHMLTPLARLPYDLAHAGWLLGMLIAYAGGVIWLGTFSSHAAIMGAWFLPVSFSFLHSQDPQLIMLLTIAASVLFAKNRKIEAGLVFGACLIKWHFLLFVPLFIVLRREWRFGAGFTAASAILVLWSFLVAPAWPLQYLDVILYPKVTPNLTEMPNLRGLLGFSKPLLWFGMALIGAATAFAIWKLREDLLALHISLLGALLAVSHSYIADCVILLPLLALLSRSDYMTRWIARLIAFPAVLPLLVLSPALRFLPQLALAALPVLLAAEAARSSPRSEFPPRC